MSKVTANVALLTALKRPARGGAGLSLRGNKTVDKLDLLSSQLSEKEENFSLQAWRVMQLGDRDIDGVLTKTEFVKARDEGAYKTISEKYLNAIEENFSTIVDLSDDDYFGDEGISPQDLGKIHYSTNDISYGQFGRQNAQDNEETMIFLGMTAGLLAQAAVWMVNPKRAIALHLGGAMAGAGIGFYESTASADKSPIENTLRGALAGAAGYAAIATTPLAAYATSTTHEKYWETFVKPEFKALYLDIESLP